MPISLTNPSQKANQARGDRFAPAEWPARMKGNPIDVDSLREDPASRHHVDTGTAVRHAFDFGFMDD
jgi:hypothetical protein